ncbi:patatin-like phospholipase family protein [Pseudomonas sp. B21-017]|uniref:patatin-like phospholipase family protein n=1 Tax=Pseudomonas sp. B21-017 TaxID=2895474 RepID=UPI0021601D64|nr:patatin-like phospholipase family protein [Pseudomonas sp. B21-017]UVM36041.1 patatin-like phospholipase family protein [Pseudomonas sp. B21-017]
MAPKAGNKKYIEYTPFFNNDFGKLGVKIANKWPESSALKRNGKTKNTLGIALSGGGYRSAIFCYGILRGLYELGVLEKIDYISAVSGGAWIATPFAMAENLDYFFNIPEDRANFIEEGFESLLVNPLRLMEEAALTRPNNNYVSDLFGRLLARTFLREYGDYGRYNPLNDPNLIKDDDRPFLIVNGTLNFRRPDAYDITQECFEMTRLYCGSRSLGYLDTENMLADDDTIRIRDAIAISGAAVAVHVPGLGNEVSGHGLSREIINFATGQKTPTQNPPKSNRLDVADGGHYNNLGIESLVNRGCGYIIAIDAEHDPEHKIAGGSRQKFEGLRTLMQRNHIPLPEFVIKKLDRANEPLHLVSGDSKVPDILYIKLKSLAAFNKFAAKRPYNKSSFLRNMFDRGEFAFDPQFSTAKLDYSFAEHRNLTELGTFIVKENADIFTSFAKKSK